MLNPSLISSLTSDLSLLTTVARYFPHFYIVAMVQSLELPSSGRNQNKRGTRIFS